MCSAYTYTKRGILLMVFLVFYLSLSSQSYFSVLTYNCENAFDTIHDTGKDDYEFLPSGERRYSKYRMFRKLKGIMKVIASADADRPVDLIGLCEVENDTVLTYLTSRTALNKMRYRYVMTDSEDNRGIDVALLYSPFTFHLINYCSVRVDGLDKPTRDILVASGTLFSGDTLDVMVCHLPSKLGGRNSDTRRLRVAEKLRSVTDSLLSVRTNPNLLIMGDFNAEYTKSLFKDVMNVDILYSDTTKNSVSNHQLFDIVADKKEGTYKYKGEWSLIDHIIVSGNLIQGENIYLNYHDCSILSPSFLLEDDNTYGGKKPFRTYIWKKYNGGYSDHLPVFVRFTIK